MTVYYRSDTRKPDEIFSSGFKPFMNSPMWWLEAISFEKITDKKHYDIIDATIGYSVCLTTKLESAAYFPCNDHTKTYIYAVSLPEAVYVDPVNPQQEVFNDKVIDFHSLQVYKANQIFETRSQAKNFIPKSIRNKITNLEVHNYRRAVTYPLFAYEHIVHHVDTNNIICAVACERSNDCGRDRPADIDEAAFHQQQLNHQRFFTLKSTIFYNSKFNTRENSANHSQNDFTHALAEFNHVGFDQENKTPNPYYGLGGKTFK